MNGRASLSVQALLLRAFVLTIVCTQAAQAATVSPLVAAGYSVLPAPQRATLKGAEFHIGAAWHLHLEPGVAENHVAVEALNEGLAARHGFHFAAAALPDGPAITLAIRAGSVSIESAQDRDKDTLANEAYRIELSEQGVRITANADAGLFYGVETLIQLLKHRNGESCLPAGEIVDWPDLQLRAIYWDDAHHLERLEALKHAIRQAAFFKINGFVIKLDGHFQFKSAPALVEPYALSPAEFQQLTDYGLRYRVQLIPYLDAPAHIAFILKHPEYAALRAVPDCNYELCTTNPASYTLLYGMYQDLLDANKGVKYFFLSTDEAYYMGLADDPKCSEAARQKELGSPGKVLAEFLTKAAGYLHERGRTVLFWGEFPMTAADVLACPAHLVNGETNGLEFDAACKARGIRQMIYVSVEGEEQLFPEYALMPPGQLLHARESNKDKIANALTAIQSDATRRNTDLMGVQVAAWADMGLHPETFWLGYVTVTSAAWNPRDASAQQASADFYRLFHGPSAHQMDRVYRLMSTQAQFWSDSWETAPSKARKGIWGNSKGAFQTRRPAQDQTLPLPKAPLAETLAPDSDWKQANARRMELVEKSLAENDELISLLHENLRRAEFNHFTLEVFLSIANLCRQNLELLRGIERMNGLLTTAHQAAKDHHPAQAVAELDKAIEFARELRNERETVLKDTAETWTKSWCPRVAEANGRKFLHDLDDVKDHLPDRTIGMEYLVYRELLLPFGQWVAQIQAARNQYAKAHQLPEKDERFDW